MKRKILNVLSVLISLVILNSGLNKVFTYIPVPEGLPEEVIKDDAALLEVAWLLPLVASAEIIGSILLWFPRTRALGALIVFPVMVGVLLVHLTVYPAGLPMVIVIWAVLIWMIYENRHKYLPLLRP